MENYSATFRTKYGTIRQMLILIACVIVTCKWGILSHEFGHWISAKLLGFKSVIRGNYNVVDWSTSDREISESSFIITAGGIISTFLLSLLGCIGYVRLRALKMMHPIKIFVLMHALFCLRFILLFAQQLYYKFFNFECIDDETKISKHLHLNELSLTSMLAVYSSVVVFLCLKQNTLSENVQIVTAVAIGSLTSFLIYL